MSLGEGGAAHCDAAPQFRERGAMSIGGLASTALRQEVLEHLQRGTGKREQVRRSADQSSVSTCGPQICVVGAHRCNAQPATVDGEAAAFDADEIERPTDLPRARRVRAHAALAGELISA